MTLYFQLFCNDAETTALLNHAAGAGLAYLQISVARDLLLSVARLCDPASSPIKGGKIDNCTFHYLIDLIEADGRPDLVRRLKRRFEQVIKKRCTPLMEARKKRLAHNDHITMLRMMDGKDLLSGIRIADLNKIIRSMRKLMAEVAAGYRLADFNIPYDFSGPRFGNEIPVRGRDFRHLIECLREGKAPEPPSIEDWL